MEKNLRIIVVSFSKSCNTVKEENSFNQTTFPYCQSHESYDTELETVCKDKHVKISTS